MVFVVHDLPKVGMSRAPIKITTFQAVVEFQW